MASEAIGFDRAELRSVIRAFKAMDDEAIDQARQVSGDLAQYATRQIQAKALTRRVAAIGVQRVADGIKVSKSSKVGEISIGFKSQKFSGGANTQMLWAGLEFGSNRYKQFPNRTPREGRGNQGYFIYPTLKEIQPYILKEWGEAFTKILKRFD